MSTDNSQGPGTKSSVLKSTAIISAGTLSSRILGFVRDMVLAVFLGTGPKAEAFFVALRIPNLLRDIVGEGAANAALVPVFSEYVALKDKQKLWHFVSAMFAASLLILSGVTLLGIWAAPWLVSFMAPGFVEDPDKLHLTIVLTRWLFPYLVLISFTAYGMGILYSFRSFLIPAFSPCLLNLAMMAGIWLAVRTHVDPVVGLTCGVLAGGFLQLLVHLWALRRFGFRFCRVSSLAHPGVTKVGKLLLPRLLGAGIYQISVFIDTFCASLSFLIGPGGIAAIYYANRIIQFPMGIFSVALASALLPALSKFYAEKEERSFRETLVSSLNKNLFLMLPISVLIIGLAGPIVRLLFERGAFDQYSSRITAMTLMCYGLGLVSFGSVKVLVASFHARQDTRTPVKTAFVSLLVNVFLNVLLMPFLGVGGIALASASASSLNAVLLLRKTQQTMSGLGVSLQKPAVKILLASLIMAVFLAGVWAVSGRVPLWFRFGFSVISSGGVYFLLCLKFQLAEALELRRWIFKKR